MASYARRTLLNASAFLAGFVFLASPADAQSPGLGGDPYQNHVATTASPYWGYTYDPYGGYLSGAAAVIQSQGDFLIKTQQAALIREDVRQKRLETRRLEMQQWDWERDWQAAELGKARERIRQVTLERSRNFPPMHEILAAASLNTLYDDLAKRPDLPTAGSTPVEQESLAHIHVTVDGRGNIGLLQSDRIFWPELLLRPDFADDHQAIDQLLTQVKEQAMNQSAYFQIDPVLLRNLRNHATACLERIRELVRSGVDDPGWNPRHYSDARQFLHQVQDAILVLEQPDAAFYLKPLQGNSVAEVVSYMKSKGVRFAPATVGCERYYMAMYHALADEETRLQPQPALTTP